MNISAQSTNLEAEIISSITSVPKDIPAGKGDGEWTAAIKRSLLTLGMSRGYEVCASGFPNECHGEWLFDLVWYRNEPDQHLREIKLILESEWNVDPTTIKYDFEKLLVAKSPIKAMVFQDNQNNLRELWSLLERGIQNFQTPPTGEKYILMAYQNGKDAFAVRTITA